MNNSIVDKILNNSIDLHKYKAFNKGRNCIKFVKN